MFAVLIVHVYSWPFIHVYVKSLSTFTTSTTPSSMPVFNQSSALFCRKCWNLFLSLHFHVTQKGIRKLSPLCRRGLAHFYSSKHHGSKLIWIDITWDRGQYFAESRNNVFCFTGLKRYNVLCLLLKCPLVLLDQLIFS